MHVLWMHNEEPMEGAFSYQTVNINTKCTAPSISTACDWIWHRHDYKKSTVRKKIIGFVVITDVFISSCWENKVLWSGNGIKFDNVTEIKILRIPRTRKIILNLLQAYQPIYTCIFAPLQVLENTENTTQNLPFAICTFIDFRFHFYVF